MSFVADLVADALERSVIGSFTRVASAIRRRLDPWSSHDGNKLAVDEGAPLQGSWGNERDRVS